MEGIEINGKNFRICRILSKNRNASARLKDDTIVVSVPSRWPRAEKEKTFSSLLRRAVKAIANGSWNPDAHKKIVFSDGQRLRAMDREFEVVFIPAKRFGSRIRDGKIEVKVDEGHPQKHKKASDTVRRRIIESLMPDVLDRVKSINESYFNVDVSGVRIRDTTSIWGSCSPDGSLCLGFRLLFMPQEILDYVIAHELAHMRYKSHGKRFWGLVERAVPDHMERRRWLRENGWSVTPQKRIGQQSITDFINKEEVETWDTRMRR